jgi:hypothetical protein
MLLKTAQELRPGTRVLLTHGDGDSTAWTVRHSEPADGGRWQLDLRRVAGGRRTNLSVTVKPDDVFNVQVPG